MIPFLQNCKTLFVFSDPGGAKPCLAMAEIFEKADVMIISDRDYSFYTDFKNDVSLSSIDEISALIEVFSPLQVITGTSYTSKIELYAIKIAKEKVITVFSFIDHWTKMKERFYITPNVLILPDYILVIDDTAKKNAIESGLPSERISITGNPYHSWLKSWHPKISRNLFLDSCGLETKKTKFILYAPDPLSNINGKQEYGFDELGITQSLINIINKNNVFFKDYLILLKPHPNQNIEELDKIVKNSNNFLMLSSNVGVNEYIYFADIVISFFSSLLIEAKVLNKKIIRIYEGDIYNDPLNNKDIGVLTRIDDLVYTIKKIS